MQVNLSVLGIGEAITNNWLVFMLYEASAPTARVALREDPPPQSFPRAVSIYVPNPVVHIVKIYSVPEGETTGVLLADFRYDPSYTNVEVRVPLELTVDGSGPFDPVGGTQTLPVIPSLRGWDWYPEMRSKSGTLHSTEYSKIESVPGEGFDSYSLLGDDQFISPDFIFIHFKPKISVQQPVFTYLNLYNGVKLIEADDTMDATYYRNLCEIATTGVSPVIQLLPKANVPDNTLLVFSTKRGAQKQATIRADIGETIECDNEAYPALFLGQGEIVWVLYLDGKWRVANDWHGMQRVGIQVDIEVIRPNIILFNGGGLVDGGGGHLPLPRAQWPRAEWYVNTQLTPSQLLTKAARDAGGLALSGFWAIDDDNIWAPDYRGHQKRALPGNRGNDSTRDQYSLPGSYGPDMFKSHTHFTVTSQGINTGGNFPPSVSWNRSIPYQWTHNNGNSAGFYLAGSDPGRVPEFGPTSPSGGAETIGKTNGVLVGCYI